VWKSASDLRNKKTRARHLSRIEEERNVYRVLVGKSVGKRYFEDLGVDGNLILKWILRIL